MRRISTPANRPNITAHNHCPARNHYRCIDSVHPPAADSHWGHLSGVGVGRGPEIADLRSAGVIHADRGGDLAIGVRHAEAGRGESANGYGGRGSNRRCDHGQNKTAPGSGAVPAAEDRRLIPNKKPPRQAVHPGNSTSRGRGNSSNKPDRPGHNNIGRHKGSEPGS